MSRSSRLSRASLGGDHVALPCNLSDGAAVDQLVPQAVEALGGKLDILVNNAGVTRDNLLMRMKDEEFEDVIRINLEAAFRLMRAAAKPMMRARFGRIISITSVVGVTGNPGQANYVASKAGLIGMTKAVAQELASRGITVNAVAPGFMTSAMTDALNEQQREAHPFAHSARRDGLGRRHRRGLRLSRVERGGLRHRADAPRQRRHGDALDASRRVSASLAAVLVVGFSPPISRMNSTFRPPPEGPKWGWKKRDKKHGQGHWNRLGHDQQLRRRHGRRQAEGHRE